MTIRLNPIAEKSASISILREGQECTVAPAPNAGNAQTDFNLQPGQTCKMTNAGPGRAYVYVQVGGDVEVEIDSKTDKLRPGGNNCDPISQMYSLPQGVVAEFRAV